jgi:hypothetical protein
MVTHWSSNLFSNFSSGLSKPKGSYSILKSNDTLTLTTCLFSSTTLETPPKSLPGPALISRNWS